MEHAVFKEKVDAIIPDLVEGIRQECDRLYGSGAIDPAKDEMTTAEAIRVLMRRYDEYRARWIAQFGTAAGYDAWFTAQVGWKS